MPNPIRHHRKPVVTQVNTSGGAVRITQPSSKRGEKPTAREAAAVVVDVVTPKAVDGFFAWLKEYAVVGLAVGFIVGQQANAVVKQLVVSFLDPLTQVWFGTKLSERTATLHHNATVVPIPWGAFVYTLIQFFFVLITIYALIKIFRLDKFEKKEDEEKK